MLNVSFGCQLVVYVIISAQKIVNLHKSIQPTQKRTLIASIIGKQPVDLSVLGIDEMGQQIFDLAPEVAAGRQTCAERNRSVPFNYLKQGPSF